MTTGPEPALQIYSDASYFRHMNYGHGAWGAVLVWQDGDNTQHEVHGGTFRQSCENSTQAELQGVVNALHIAIASGRVKRGQAVVVCADCKTVVQILCGHYPRHSRTVDHLAPVWKLIRQIASEARLDVTGRWTPGHQAGGLTAENDDARFNALADRAARDANPALMKRSERRKLARLRQATRKRLARAREAELEGAA
jgi:ribonuclease HI